jgi:hypothetical protein
MKTLVVVLSIFASSCGAMLQKVPDTPGDDWGGFSVVAAGLVAHDTINDPKATPKEKAEARRIYLKAAYDHAIRSEGLRPAAARKVAQALVDDTEVPDLTCADFVRLPPGCGGR